MNRTASIKRDTKETKISIELNLDGTGQTDCQTGVGFLDHMLDHLAKHSLCDLKDISGRSAVVWDVKFAGGKIGSFDTQLIEEFLRRLAAVARINLHVAVPYGSNDHHIAEAIFKATAQALRQAKAIDPARQGEIPSTKGTL